MFDKQHNRWKMYAHEAIDISAKPGTLVRAAKDGEVVASWKKWEKGGKSEGNFVKIDHHDGTYAIYMHLNGDDQVDPGTWVTNGTPIGHVGRTGNVEGKTHLHFQVQYDKGHIVCPLITTGPGAFEKLIADPWKRWSRSQVESLREQFQQQLTNGTSE